MSGLWQDKLRKIDPYVPGEQAQIPDLVKLNANENPYPPSPRVAEVFRTFAADDPAIVSQCERNAAQDRTRRAPRRIARRSLSATARTMCSRLRFRLFLLEQPVLFPDITYSFYPVWCSLFRTPYETVPLDAQFRINPRDYDRPSGGVLLPNPNAPTGIAENRAFLEDILTHNQDCVVIIDEAYVDFGAWSCVPLLRKSRQSAHCADLFQVALACGSAHRRCTGQRNAHPHVGGGQGTPTDLPTRWTR